MGSIPKYKAKHVYWNSRSQCVMHEIDVEVYRCYGKLKLPEYVWRFDSQHEFLVYLQLIRMYGAENIGRQIKIEIIAPGLCYPKGKYWKVDFAVFSNPKYLAPVYYVEAKGAFLPEFACILSHLEARDNSLFNDLRIVFSSKIPNTNRVVKALLNSEFSKNITTLKDLKALKELP